MPSSQVPRVAPSRGVCGGLVELHRDDNSDVRPKGRGGGTTAGMFKPNDLL